MGLTLLEQITELISLVQAGAQGTCVEIVPTLGAIPQAFPDSTPLSSTEVQKTPLPTLFVCSALLHPLFAYWHETLAGLATSNDSLWLATFY